MLRIVRITPPPWLVHRFCSSLSISGFLKDLSWGVSSAFKWLCCVCLQTRLGPGPRQRGRQVQEEGFPTLEGEARAGTERAERSGGLHKRNRGPQRVVLPGGVVKRGRLGRLLHAIRELCLRCLFPSARCDLIVFVLNALERSFDARMTCRHHHLGLAFRLGNRCTHTGLNRRCSFRHTVVVGGAWRPQDDCLQLPVSNAMDRQTNG